MQHYSADPTALDALFVEQMRKTVEEWVEFADERLEGSGIQCIVCPGNDDTHDIDEILATSSTMLGRRGQRHRPARRLPARVERLDQPHALGHPAGGGRGQAQGAPHGRSSGRPPRRPERLVFGLHAPPYDTQLDVAPKIIWESLEIQGQDTAHVGSTAVREVIEEVQPLLSLHGHIHEGRAAIRMGRTLVVNPGSSYVEGTLDGCVVELDGKDKVKKYRLTSG